MLAVQDVSAPEQDDDAAESIPTCVIADDDALMRDYLAALFQKRGYRAELAADGRSALDLILRHRPVFALLDLMMPGLSGHQLLSAIRRLEPVRETPVIMLTRSQAQADLLRALDQGADDYIVKPCQGSSLVARVHDVLAFRH